VSGTEQPAPDRRAAFRAFVREHHPDRGGDPAEFAAGMERFRSERGADVVPGSGDLPVAPVPADPLPFPVRVGVALIRTWRRRHEDRIDGS
jgi:hypothetical protein